MPMQPKTTPVNHPTHMMMNGPSVATASPSLKFHCDDEAADLAKRRAAHRYQQQHPRPRGGRGRRAYQPTLETIVGSVSVPEGGGVRHHRDDVGNGITGVESPAPPPAQKENNSGSSPASQGPHQRRGSKPKENDHGSSSPAGKGQQQQRRGSKNLLLQGMPPLRRGSGKAAGNMKLSSPVSVLRAGKRWRKVASSKVKDAAVAAATAKTTKRDDNIGKKVVVPAEVTTTTASETNNSHGLPPPPATSPFLETLNHMASPFLGTPNNKNKLRPVREESPELNEDGAPPAPMTHLKRADTAPPDCATTNGLSSPTAISHTKNKEGRRRHSDPHPTIKMTKRKSIETGDCDDATLQKEANTQYNLGLLYVKTGAYAKARANLTRALHLHQKLRGMNSIESASVHEQFGLIAVAEHNAPEAKVEYERALRILDWCQVCSDAPYFGEGHRSHRSSSPAVLISGTSRRQGGMSELERTMEKVAVRDLPTSVRESLRRTAMEPGAGERRKGSGEEVAERKVRIERALQELKL